MQRISKQDAALAFCEGRTVVLFREGPGRDGALTVTPVAEGKERLGQWKMVLANWRDTFAAEPCFAVRAEVGPDGLPRGEKYGPEEILAELEYEIRMRVQVFGRKVRNREMTQATMEKRIGILEQLADRERARVHEQPELFDVHER